jgi:hypothetical protein
VKTNVKFAGGASSSWRVPPSQRSVATAGAAPAPRKTALTPPLTPPLPVTAEMRAAEAGLRESLATSLSN